MAVTARAGTPSRGSKSDHDAPPLAVIRRKPPPVPNAYALQEPAAPGNATAVMRPHSPSKRPVPPQLATSTPPLFDQVGAGALKNPSVRHSDMAPTTTTSSLAGHLRRVICNVPPPKGVRGS